jgi:hypothetical protein
MYAAADRLPMAIGLLGNGQRSGAAVVLDYSH